MHTEHAWRIRYYLAYGMLTLIRRLPECAALSLGRGVGGLVWACDPFHRRVVRVQLSNALPDEPGRTVRRVFMHQGELLVDAIRYADFDLDELTRRLHIEGRDYLETALKSGRGVMLITAHLGNWEILAHLSRLLDMEFCVMADRRNDPLLDRLVDELRERSGATILPPRGKARMLVRELRKARVIGMVVDQRGSRHERLFVPFFDLPAPTNSAPAWLACKGRALALPVFAVREQGGYRVRFLPALDAATYGDGAEAVRALSADMQGLVEEGVRRWPEQWFWAHCRWTRRADMRRIFCKDLDFREYVLRQEAAGLQKTAED